LEKARMKRMEKREEEKRKRSVSPPVSDSDGEFLHSEVEEEKVADDEEAPSSRAKKRRRVYSSDEDGYEDDDDPDSARKKNRKKKKKETPDETLLKHIDAETKKQVSFDAIKKKKHKYNRKTSSADDGEDAAVFEDLIRSLVNYKRCCPSRTSIQVFLLSK